MLSDHTTFHLGGPATKFVTASSIDQVVSAVSAADRGGEPLLVLSGGSNLLVGDDGFAGTVVHITTKGIDADVSGCGGAVVKVQAGEVWDDFVSHVIAWDWSGVETLSGIPGLVGSTPIQNVGAYGNEVAQTIYQVRTLDRMTGQFRTFANADCGFGYRDSLFKQTRFGDPSSPTGRFVVLEVTFQLRLASLSEPIRYAELAKQLGVEVGQRAPMTQVRETVLALRRSKGMVYDPTDHDSWSAGSFFTNPLLTPEQATKLPADAPRFPQPDGRVKSSAAWLIEHAGFKKGHGTGRAGLSTKHTLALTNRGDATAEDVAGLAREVRDGVQATFGVRLIPEPVVVGVEI